MEQKFELNGVEFKVGDKVRVERAIPNHDKDGMGKGVEWMNSWVDDMDETIGKEATIIEIDKHGAYFEEFGLGYPLSALTNLSRSAPRKHGIKVGSKVKVIDGSGSRWYNDKEGRVFIVSDVWNADRISAAKDHSEDLITVEGTDERMFAMRFKLADSLTELPDVFTFRAPSGDYRMTKRSEHGITDYICTDHCTEYDPAVHVANWNSSVVLRYINDGTWTFLRDITPKVTYFVGPFSGSVYKYDVDAGVRTILDTGEVLKGVTQANVEQRRSEGWKEATAEQVKAAEAKFAADAAAEEAAKALAAAESKVAYAQAALITAINELAALKA